MANAVKPLKLRHRAGLDVQPAAGKPEEGRDGALWPTAERYGSSPGGSADTPLGWARVRAWPAAVPWLMLSSRDRRCRRPRLRLQQPLSPAAGAVDRSAARRRPGVPPSHGLSSASCTSAVPLVAALTRMALPVWCRSQWDHPPPRKVTAFQGGKHDIFGASSGHLWGIYVLGWDAGVS